MADDAAARAAAVHGYQILDTAPEDGFDDLARLAAQIGEAPIALVSFLDTNRLWFKASLGLGIRETALEASFSAHAFASDDEVFVVEDAAADDRFKANLLVLGDDRIRFYAGAPIRTAAGVAVGVVCVMDRQPRCFDVGQRAALGTLARQASALLEARQIRADRPPAAHRDDAREGFRLALRQSPVGMLLTDADGRILDTNGAFATMLGTTTTALLGVNIASLTTAAMAAAEADLLTEVLAGTRDSAIREKSYRHTAGHLVQAVSSTAAIRAADGALTGFLSQILSITEQRHAEEALLETQSAHDAIISIDATGRLTAWNTGAERLFGHPASTAIGQPVTLIVPKRWRAAHVRNLARLAGAPVPPGPPLLRTGLRADGTEFPLEVSLSGWSRAGRQYYTVIARDISEREAMHAAMLTQATTDPLTGVPNRSGATTALEAMLADTAATPLSVLTLDIVGFTEINGSLGAAGGDRVLIQTARQIAVMLRPAEMVARIGNDEFAVLLPRTTSTQALAIGERLRDDLRGSIVSRGVPVHVDICVGAASHRNQVTKARAKRTATALLLNASLALASAKRTGPGTVCGYRAALAKGARRRLTLHGALEDAITAGALTLAYQPQIDLRTGRLQAVEALARWTHPQLGPIGPDEFIPLAEDTGLMPALGAWVLATSCAHAAAWRTRGSARIGLSVNVSGRQLADDDIIGTVEHALAASGLPASTLTLEITESVLMRDPCRAAQRLAILKRLGIRISIDDFGTGHSSLASLTTFPIDELKIDRSFIAPLPQDSTALRVTTAIIALAEGLGLTTVAEGIEMPAQHQLLRDLTCTLGQGYLFARPLPADQIPSLLRTPLRLLPTLASARRDSR
ncbi:MAG TPA: EAL domain-containing protein [Acidothermaceae bacterium]